MEHFKTLRELMATAEKDAAAFYEMGNSAAGTRLRLSLQKIKVSATAISQEVAEKKRRKQWTRMPLTPFMKPIGYQYTRQRLNVFRSAEGNGNNSGGILSPVVKQG